ncbi:protein phosphatase 2C domain-containing protein [Moraxella osloensis]|uniref:PP2C family serine/threonine-protein phosphatase n=1 Tax=Faucicola osloensis TaxID=34062 RepID=UPI002002C135|nr:PP2C family serine/threonine-protein phosphatase [Moraxella osloensis]MCK6158591.1 protein phosphatase 2C domain-containing protein [Moraxella osloensis]
MNQTTDLFAQSSVQPSWQVYGASSIGKSHIDSNLPNQDSIYLQKTEHGMVAVVCDGAGSAKFSQAGAAFFSQSIGKMLLSLGVGLSVSRSVSISVSHSHSGTAVDLVQVKQQIIEQLSQIRLDLQSQLPAESSLRDYHTTFTGLLIHSNHQALLVQIGDSPLITSQFVVRHPHIDYFTNLQVYGDDSKNEYVNETHFITQDNWQSFLRVEAIDLSQVDCLALMSDGCADLVFEGASVTPKIYRPFFGNLLFNLTQSQSSQQGSAIIEQALSNPATYRLTGDDKSLVVLLKNQQHYQKLEPMVEGQNETLANESLENDTIATAPNNPTVWHTDAVNHKNTRATSTPDDVAFNDISSNNINNIALTPNPHSDSVVQTAPATPAATASQVLPPSQSVSDSTRQRRNTAMMAGAAMLIGTGILGWINKDRLLPTQTVNNANTAASVTSTTPTSAITPPLTAHALGDSYAIDLSKVATVTESGNPSDDPILKVIVASPQSQSIDAIEQNSKQTSSAKTKNKNSVNQPLLSVTVTTVVVNKNPTAATVARIASGAASTALQNQYTDATLGATLTDSQFNNHAVKLAAKASCLPVTDTHDLISLGVTIQPTMHYYNCQISLPIKSMTSQIAGLSKKTEILDSLTLDKGLSEILTSATSHTAATASTVTVTGTGLPASTVSDSSGNQQIQLYYLGITDTINHMSAIASTELAALPTSSAHLKR